MLSTDVGLYRMANGEMPTNVVPVVVADYSPPATLRPNPSPAMMKHNEKTGMIEFAGSFLTHHAQQLRAVEYGITQLAKAPKGSRAVRFRVVWNWFEPSDFTVALTRHGFAWVQDVSAQRSPGDKPVQHVDDPF